MAETRHTRAPEPDRGEPGTGARSAARARGDRVLLAAPTAERSGRGGRRQLLRLAAFGLTVVLGSVLAVSAWASPGTPEQSGVQRAALAHTVPQQPPPITELPPPKSCFPGQVGCRPGGPSSTPNTNPGTPCTGEDCIPQPSTTPPTSTAPGPDGPGVNGDDPDCGISNIEGCINKAINAVFRDLVKSALDPLVKLLGNTAFTTPTLDSLPGVANLWNNSWLIVVACYGGLIMLGGIIVMSHESVQSRYSMKEIAPRLIVSFFASMLSLFVIDKAIRLANALSAAVLADGVDPPHLGDTLAGSINGAYSAAVSGGLFVILLQLVLVIAVIALLLVYVVRVILTLILIVSAPLWITCHALPHTDGIARWGWRALGATLGIQVAQSLTLIVAVDTFLGGSVHLFNSVGGGLMMLFAVLGLLYVLFKIPFWFLSVTKLGQLDQEDAVALLLRAHRTDGDNAKFADAYLDLLEEAVEEHTKRATEQE